MPRTLLALICLLLCFTTQAANNNALTGTLLVANRNGGSISMIDLQTRTEIARLPIGPTVPHELAASPDGRWAVTSEYGSGNNPGRHLIVIDIPAAQIVRRIDLGPNTRPHSIAFMQDSRHVITTLEQSEAIALVDILNGDIIKTWPTGGQDSHMVRLAPDDSRAYVAARGSGTLSVIWLNEDRPATVIPTGARAEGIAVSPDGRQVWVANQGNQNISIIDTNSLEQTAIFGGVTTNRLEFLPDNTVVIPASASRSGGTRPIIFVDWESRQMLRRIDLPASAAAGTGVRLLAAGGSLFMADSALSEISVLAPNTSTTRDQIMMNPDNIDGMAWSPLRLEVMNE